MKRLLIIVAMFVGAEAQAIKLCQKNCTIPAEWNNTNNLAGSSDYGTGYKNVAWTATITTSPGGIIKGIAKCTASNTDSNSAPTSSGSHCWCQVTAVNGVCPGGGWANHAATGLASSCQSNCASNCATCVITSPGSVNYNCARSILLQGL